MQASPLYMEEDGARQSRDAGAVEGAPAWRASEGCRVRQDGDTWLYSREYGATSADDFVFRSALC